MRVLLQESKNLLHAFSCRSDYNGVLPQAYAEVTKLCETLREVRAALVFVHLTPSSSCSTLQTQLRFFNCSPHFH